MYGSGFLGVMRRLDGWLIDQNNAQRTLTEDDVDSFFQAAGRRKKSLTNEDVLGILEVKNSYRMWRIRHDMKWLRKQLIKLGVDPERARELV